MSSLYFAKKDIGRCCETSLRAGWGGGTILPALNIWDADVNRHARRLTALTFPLESISLHVLAVWKMQHPVVSNHRTCEGSCRGKIPKRAGFSGS